jgi:hypothetical protein
MHKLLCRTHIISGNGFYFSEDGLPQKVACFVEQEMQVHFFSFHICKSVATKFYSTMFLNEFKRKKLVKIK